MYECERLFGLTRGLEIQKLVQETLGRTCPCMEGRACILDPEHLLRPGELVAIIPA